MTIKVALPKGRLLTGTAALLERAGWQLDGYNESLRNYRLRSVRFPGIRVKVFQEKDIPIQVAIGNYDLGICGQDWIEELTSKYATTAPIRLRDLGYGRGTLYVAASTSQKGLTLESLPQMPDAVRIASEYPNIAETFALARRLRRFSIFPVWGAAEAYPPESATLALISGNPDATSFNNGLRPLTGVLDFSAFLIANRRSWEQKDLSRILSTLETAIATPTTLPPKTNKIDVPTSVPGIERDTVRLALPDGHQQKHAAALLKNGGIEVTDYPSASGNRRPACSLDGVVIKVIRPQDMPLQVANGNFDLAITGKDWLTEHLNMFPSSPVHEVADLKFGWVKIVAVVHNKVAADDISTLRHLCDTKRQSLRIASEYVNIADRYARDNRLGLYRIIPTWGATEAFLPEDADLLIENTETGSTIARHHLKIIDTLFESTGRLIGRKDARNSPVRQARLDTLVKRLRAAASK